MMKDVLCCSSESSPKMTAQAELRVTSSLNRGCADQADLSELERLHAQMADHAKKLQELEAQFQAQGYPRNKRGPQEFEENPPALGDGRAKRSPQRYTPLQTRESNSASAEESPASNKNSTRNEAISSVRSGLGSFVEDPSGKDPYDRMWAAANFQNVNLFDQELLRTIYNAPKRKLQSQAAMVGSGMMGLLSMPFGPIGMAAGGAFGGLFGALIGGCADRRWRLKNLEESALEKKRIKCLMRWATERLSLNDQAVDPVLEMVILEFKPIADIASGSKTALEQLKLLDKWVSQRSVARSLWNYLDDLLSRWKDLRRGDFIRSILVFQTLIVMYCNTQRALDEEELCFVERMERILQHKSVQSIMSHAQQFRTEGENRVMTAMVFADHRMETMRSDGEASSNGAADDGDDDWSADESATRSNEASRAASLRAATRDHLEEDVQERPCRVLKKPFFKSWNDFMDFNVTIKHKMPITLSEFDLLLEKEQESVDGWDLCVDRKEIRVVKNQAGPGVITIRAWTTIPNVHIGTVFYLFFDCEQRLMWDKVFANMQLIGNGVHGSDVLYSVLHVPGFTQRDFLQYRRVLVLEDGSIVIVLRSAEHPEMPEMRNSVRAESYISGYVFRQEWRNGEMVLKMFLMSCSDIKGLIPKWIINFVAPRKPGEWIEALKKACYGYQERNPNCREDLEGYLAKFAALNSWDYEVDLPAEPKDAPDPKARL